MKDVLHLQTDYLVIGAGAMGMAFVDELIHSSKSVRVILVDRRLKPGGHWNDAYDFVTLHQPALYYGVSSTKLEFDSFDLASKTRICQYYEEVLSKLLATGRLSFYPGCSYEGGGVFRSLTDDNKEYRVDVKVKTVNAAYSDVSVPSTHPPAYEVSDTVHCVPINALSDLQEDWERYVVIGAGKTALDALLYLMNKGVDPERIFWIVSNDAWMLRRSELHPSQFVRSVSEQFRAINKSVDPKSFFLEFENIGLLMRLDKNIWPRKFRCATVSTEELQLIKGIKNVVRKGRVQKILSEQIILENGAIPTDVHTLHIDCTADGLKRLPSRPIFEADVVTLQPVYLCQPAFSAAFIAHVESRFNSDAVKNKYCTPVPYPQWTHEYFDSVGRTFDNVGMWGLTFFGWLSKNRLSIQAHITIVQGVIILVKSIFVIIPAFKRFQKYRTAIQEERERLKAVESI